jgi:hypothetical protein
LRLAAIRKSGSCMTNSRNSSGPSPNMFALKMLSPPRSS